MRIREAILYERGRHAWAKWTILNMHGTEGKEGGREGGGRKEGIGRLLVWKKVASLRHVWNIWKCETQQKLN